MEREQGPIEFFGRFKTARGWALVIALVNLLGIAYGFYYYREQFAVTPVWLWLFVPDSPLAVLWAEAALIGYWLGWRPGVLETAAFPRVRRISERVRPFLDALAYIGNVQVGLWTVYVLLAYADAFGTYTLNLNSILLAAHAGMAVLALIFLHGLREERRIAPRRAAWAIGLAGAYYLVNDALDYFGPDFSLRQTGCGMRPYTVPCDPALEGALTAVTFGLTLVAVISLGVGMHGGRPRVAQA